MTDLPPSNIIEIEDEKDDAVNRHASTSSNHSINSSYQPMNFNPKTFPFLASMLRKMSAAQPKIEPVTPSSPLIPPPELYDTNDIPPIFEVIKPLSSEATQEVQEVTRNLPA